jgi:geranylgeranyl diphosphate synthase type II
MPIATNNGLNLEQYLKTKKALISDALDKLIPEKNSPYCDLFRAARYSLLGNGKRIRPIFTLAVCECLQGPMEAALQPACALEMVHTYSMIHDDLPSMDNDDFRRGVPTLHKTFPESHALLAGDYLLTYAFQVIAEAPGLSPEQKIKLVAILAKKSGGDGMIAGQVMDLEAERKEIGLEELQHIHRCKTGALFEAAIEFGAVIAQANEKIIDLLHHFGAKLGLAFQIIDDVLDLTAGSNKHGDASSDLANGKKTYATLFGIESSKEKAQQLLNSALKDLQSLPFDTSLLVKLAEFIVQR